MNTRIRKKCLDRLRIPCRYVGALTDLNGPGLVDACVHHTRAGRAAVITSEGRAAVLLPAEWLYAATTVMALSGVGDVLGEHGAVLRDPMFRRAATDDLYRRAFPTGNLRPAVNAILDTLSNAIRPVPGWTPSADEPDR
jgi:hypothetical protein